MQIILNGSEIKTESDVHRTLAGTLDFGPYYGRNLAALWDRLTTDVERPLAVLWLDADLSCSSMGKTQFERIVTLFKDIEKHDEALGLEDRFSIELK